MSIVLRKREGATIYFEEVETEAEAEALKLKDWVVVDPEIIRNAESRVSREPNPEAVLLGQELAKKLGW